MGRDWLSQFEVNLNEINLVKYSSPVKEVLDNYSSVFTDELGCLQDMSVKLIVHDQAKPKFFKPRSVPLVLQQKVEKCNQKVTSTIFLLGSPGSTCNKKIDTIRLCGDKPSLSYRNLPIAKG